MVLTIWSWYGSWWIIQKSEKMHFWMIQRAKIEVLGHFLEFCLLYRLEIAYCDGTKYFLSYDNVTRSWRIIGKWQKCIFESSKEPKMRFLAIFWGLVRWIGLILHIVMVVNVFRHLATLPGHEGSFKNRKNAFLNDPMCRKRDFWPFSGVSSVGLTW